MIHLQDIDESNWRVPLHVTPEQEPYVASSTVLLARAYAYRNARSRALLICQDETPVGMVMYHDEPEMDAYIFSEMFIDQRYQGQGYGAQAVQLVLDRFRRDGQYAKVVLCYIEGNEAARKLYTKFGFTECDRDEDEIIMELTL